MTGAHNRGLCKSAYSADLMELASGSELPVLIDPVTRIGLYDAMLCNSDAPSHPSLAGSAPTVNDRATGYTSMESRLRLLQCCETGCSLYG